MKTNDKRTVLQSLFNGKSKQLKKLKAAERLASIPSVFILMPDGSIDVGDSKAFGSRYVTEVELNRVLEQIESNRTVFIIPDNGRKEV